MFEPVRQAGDGVDYYTLHQGAIAKWLQRQIRNLFLYEGAGSNPAGVGLTFFFLSALKYFPTAMFSLLSPRFDRHLCNLRGTLVLRSMQYIDLG